MKRAHLFAIGAAIPLAFFAFVVATNVGRKSREPERRASFGGASKPDEYAGYLEHSDPAMRRRAAFALAEQGDGRAVEPLLAVLAERRAAVAEGGAAPSAAANHETADAVRLLAKLGDRRAIDAIEALLASEDDGVLTASVRALGVFRSPMSVDPLESLLARMLSDYDPDAAATSRTNLITEVAAALSRLGEGEKAHDRRLALGRAYEAERAYREALSNYVQAELLAVSDHSRRAAAAKADEMRELLAKGAEESAVGRLIGHLELGTAEKRLDAAKKLSGFRDPRAMEAFIRALEKETAPEVRAAVLEGLAGYSQDRRAFGAVVAGLASDEFAVRDAAARALGASGNPLAAAPLIEALEKPAPLKARDEYVYSVAETIVKALGELGEPSAIQPLANYYRGAADDNVKREIVISLGRLGATAQLVHIAQTSPSSALQREAVKGLGRSGDVRVTPSLLTLIGKDPQLDPEIALALGALEDASAVPQLLDALRSESAELRLASVMALGKIGDPRAREPLRYVAENDGDRRVRSVAEKAIAVFKDRTPAPEGGGASPAVWGDGEGGGPIVYEDDVPPSGGLESGDGGPP